MIYIVDDNPAIRDSLALVLEITGYSVRQLDCGEELLAVPDISPEGCIVLDVDLPGESGLQILTRLRNRGVSTPVIIFSGRADECMRHEAEQRGACGCVQKPAQVDTLLDLIAASGLSRPASMGSVNFTVSEAA